MIEGTFREMLITLSKMKISLCTIDMAEVRHHKKMIKHDFLKIWEKNANLGGAESEKFKC